MEKHFRLKDFDPADTGHWHSVEEAKEQVQKDIQRMEELQAMLYARSMVAAADFSGHGCRRQRRYDQTRHVRSES